MCSRSVGRIGGESARGVREPRVFRHPYTAFSRVAVESVRLLRVEPVKGFLDLLEDRLEGCLLSSLAGGAALDIGE